MHQLLERIMKEQMSFPAAQRLVAAYVVDNCYQIPFLSISALAKNVGVSDATITKFCARLGFDGYVDFKKVFSESMHSELIMYNKVVGSSDEDGSGGSLFEAVSNAEVANIRTTMMNPVNHSSLNKLLPMLKEAKNIYMLGGRSSTYLADYFANTLRHLGLQVHSLNGALCDYYDRIYNVHSDDLVIVFCFPRYTALTIELMQILHSRNVPLALITDTGLSPAYPFADVSFHCSVSLDGYFPGYTSCMAIINVIARAASVYFKDSASEHIHQLEKHLLEKNVFLPHEKCGAPDVVLGIE